MIMNTSSALLTDTNTVHTDPLASHKNVLQQMSQQVNIPVVFKRQKPWQHVNTDNINLIKAGTNKCDMPNHSLVVWCECNLPVWRYTGGHRVATTTGYASYTRHFEIQQCSNMLYINGTDFRGSISDLRMLLELMLYTYPILIKVYGINGINKEDIRTSY
jgi:hypothetical protein